MAAATLIKSAICRTSARHRPAPSLFYFPGLSSRPLFNPTDFAVSAALRANAATILSEYQTLRAVSPASDYDTSGAEADHTLHEGGKWDWNSYVIKGKRQAHFAACCPVTTEILESHHSRLMTDTPFSFAFFSTLHGNTSIKAHHGPCNLRVRCHFPLIVPTEQDGDCGMQIGHDIVRWVPNEPIFFDDCYEHKVWNNTDKERVVLLFDIWHPELEEDEILAIQSMFGEAKSKGWLSQ